MSETLAGRISIIMQLIETGIISEEEGIALLNGETPESLKKRKQWNEELKDVLKD